MPNIRSINHPAPAQSELEKSTQWHTLHCKLVTPMYSGGVESTKVDEKMPIRVTAIRGQLRFWWRLLAKQKWKLQGDALRKAEFALWGGMSDGDDGQASKVLLRVNLINSPKIERWAEYDLNNKNKYILKPKDWSDAPYALFPAQGKLDKTRTNIEEQPHKLLKQGLKWQLHIAFLPTIKTTTPENSKIPSEKEQVWEAIRWWANFGGIGARTRRGLGAFIIQKNDYFKSCITVEEVASIKLDIKLKSANCPIQGWTNAVNKLSYFRQIDIGRDSFNSRSHWPEPDAIRRITNQYLKSKNKEHFPMHKAGKIFPRAGFGLPIIFKFKDNNAKGDSLKPCDDPHTTTLILCKQDGSKAVLYERLSSPLILRPYQNEDGKWFAMALLLPDILQSDPSLRLRLSSSLKKAFKDYSVGYLIENNPENKNGDGVEKVKPLTDYDAKDALQAFLTYFAK